MRSKRPTVDIVVNNYNYGQFLRAAIDSALEQTETDVHVIVVDDGSTDSSRAIIASYGDRIDPILKPNGGQASALNAGFQRSTADLVIFLDADDMLLPDTARRVCAVANSHPTVAKIQYRLEVVDVEGQPTGALLPPEHIPFPSGDLRQHALTFPFDLPWVATSGNAFPGWVLRRLLPIPEREFTTLADLYLKHLAALLGPVLSLDWVGARYRIHGSNSYAVLGSRLDLEYIRQSIVYASTVKRHLVNLADDLRMESPKKILSVADVANRMVSCRLEPAQHPIPHDTVLSLVFDGWRACVRRFNVSPAMRALFGAWFVGMAIAPQRVTVALAEWFLFPERRPLMNRALASLHRQRARH